MAKYRLVKENIDKGDGVDLDAYGYKLVPKNKAGNYVQKGSKLDVKQQDLFAQLNED